MHFTKDMHRDATPVAVPAAFAGIVPPPAQAQTNAYQGGLKRMFDICAIVLALPVVVPVIAVLALLVRLGGGPAFYRQDRVGRGGRLYTMWKLRTMVADADAKLAAHLNSNPAARAEWALTQKLKADPRITPIGRLLRRTSLDELPQLFNVLRGDMSLVGPRPMLPEQQQMYPGTAYYRLLPGITGPWQISARNEAAFAERAAFDTGYLYGLSFWTDLKMILKTFRVVVRATGH